MSEMTNEEKAKQLVRFMDEDDYLPSNMCRYLTYYDEDGHIEATVEEYKRIQAEKELMGILLQNLGVNFWFTEEGMKWHGHQGHGTFPWRTKASGEA